MRITTPFRAVTAGALTTAAAVFGLTAPAQAAPVTPYYVCSPSCQVGDALGNITWNNRTAVVSGDVTDVGPGSTTAVFEAFAGSKKIDSETRAADDTGSVGSPRGYTFTIGDPDLRGGIDRIKITVCFNYDTDKVCGDSKNYSRP